MKITWVTRSFLDYRIPVFAELDNLCGHRLSVIYYADVVPGRVQDKLKAVIGERAIGMSGEIRFFGKKSAPVSSIKRGGVRIPYQPGLIGAIRRTTPDVIVTDGFFQWTYAALFLRMFPGTRHVMCYEPTAHTERHAQWYRKSYRKMACHWVDRICCNGLLCRTYLQSMGYPGAKIIEGNMAADSDQLAAEAQKISIEAIAGVKRNYHLTGIVFIFVGRLVPLKGIHELLMAWRELPPDAATLLLVGDGEQKEFLSAFCRDNSLRNVVFAGNRDYDELPVFYRSADVLIIPTLQDNWSLVVPEAMACGLPVASSIYNGCHPELVKPENGWLFDPLNRDAMVKIFKQMIAERGRYSAMGEASRRIVANYSPAHAAKNIFTACERAITE